MNRKHLCTGICVAVCLIVGSILLCCRQDDAENLLMEDGQTPTEAVTSLWQKAAPEKFYHFSSEEEVLAISEEDMFYIEEHEYRTSDFVTDMSQDALDLLRDDSILYYELDFKGEEVTDLEQDLPEERFWELIEECCDWLFRSYDFYYEEDGTKTEGKGWRIIQSRETEQYIECRIRYLEKTIEGGGGTAVPKPYEETYRFVKGKYFDSKNGGYIYLGTMTTERMKWYTDIDIVENDTPVIYREVRETDNTITVIHYWVDMEITEQGENNKLRLCRAKRMYDKKMHRVYQCVEEVKVVEVEGTEDVYFREAPPV